MILTKQEYVKNSTIRKDKMCVNGESRYVTVVCMDELPVSLRFSNHPKSRKKYGGIWIYRQRPQDLTEDEIKSIAYEEYHERKENQMRALYE